MDKLSGSKEHNRALNIDGLVNARDLGGLRRKNGTVTPHGVFYRSENIDLVRPFGWSQLKDSGVKTVIDLRQPEERDRDAQERPDWLHIVNFDLDGVENETFWGPYLAEGLESTSMYYLDHLQRMPERAAAVLDEIAQAPDSGVLFHCKSGRDRTGLIALLLLAAIDTEPEAIVDDYLETVRLGDVRGKRLGRVNPEPGLEKLLQKHGTTTENAFRDALAGLAFSEFLKNSKLSNTSIKSLKTWRGSAS
ncbi:MAG: tyrosine-protein phosphatase [Chloroflexi bacterium]|nr:MAG: tyrosine-protein phosphatase [Chloroflexota bacterium]